MGRSFVQLLFLLSCAVPVCWCAVVPECGVSVVLVGSTGDLARRYLWPAIFHHYRERHCLPSSSSSSSGRSRGCGLTVVGGSRREPQYRKGEDGWGDILDEIRCDTVSCELCLRSFKNATHRLKISEEKDYKVISTVLHDIYEGFNQTEVGRIFYLSVPPSAYPGIVHHIDLHSRPQDGAWLRVVLEKPFGSDLSSAEALAGKVARYLDEESVYRVDHYLGKPGVQQILPFRRANSAKLRPLWGREHIQHVEVVMKERLDVKGRSGFFNEYGILRDMHQNHLTEVLLRILMEPEVRSEEFQKRKVELLRNIFSPTLQQSVLGQYAGYHTHLVQDGVQSSISSSVPTFATVALYSREPNWRGVPFLLTAGKKLGERKAFARIVFKQWKFSLTNESLSSCPAEITFLIQDEALLRPGILVSQHFFEMGLEYGDWEWTQMEIGSCSYAFLSSIEVPPSNAYIAVVGDILTGLRERIVDTPSLLGSWEVWNPLLMEINSTSNLNLIQYLPEDLSVLNFRIHDRKLIPEVRPVLHSNITKVEFASSEKGFEHCGLVPGPIVSTVRGTELQVSSCLARELSKSAWESVRKRGVFHLALPGGRSPQLLFNLLSLEYGTVFPWQHTHIWQTDERCVPSNHSDSNWNQIYNLLLSQVHVPYHHLHPMPVVLENGICVPKDDGCGFYADQLTEVELDHVVLGVGRDGHTASIFPQSSLSDLSDRNRNESWVHMVQLKDTAPSAVKHRMSMSLKALLSARKVSVLLVGSGKEGVMDMIMGGGEEEEVEELPIVTLLRYGRNNQIILYTTS